MNANVKIILGLAVLVASVVGVTVISQFSEGEPERKTTGPSGFGGGIPLAFKDSAMYFNPQSDIYSQREFPGFYEVNAEIHWATYLLRNPNPVSVQVTAVSRSCTACTTARLAVLSEAESKAMKNDDAKRAAIGGVMFDAEIGLYQRAETGSLNWKELDFENPDKALTIPAAVDAETPTWCVLQLGFQVRETKALVAEIGMLAEGMKAPFVQKFTVAFIADSAERVSPTSYDFGTFSEKAEPKSVELYYWSTTRPKTSFAPPKLGGLDGDPFLSTSTPVPLTTDELNTLARRASGEKFAVRARGGYKFTVTLRRNNTTLDGPRELDIGPFERQISVSGSDGSTTGQTVQLTANILGLVSLDQGDAVNLGDFRGRDGKTVEFRLTSDQLGLQIEPLNGTMGTVRDHNPPGLTVTPVGEPTVTNGVKRWTFKLTAAKDALGGSITGKLLVFRAKGTGQMVRIPLKGTANGN